MGSSCRCFPDRGPKERPPNKEGIPPIIVNGLRYRIGAYSLNAAIPRSWKGLGGREWTIRFHDRSLLRTDDLLLDLSFKTVPEKDTAVIIEGWFGVTLDSPIYAWRTAGDFRVYAKVGL